MKRFLSLFVSCLIAVGGFNLSPGPVYASNVFGGANTDHIVCGSGSAIDDLPSGVMTVLMRVYKTSTGNNLFLAAKQGAWGRGWSINVDDFAITGDLSFSVNRATTGATITSDNAHVPINTWRDVMAVVDLTDTPVVRFYSANSGDLLVEGGYATTLPGYTNGSGAYASDASDNLWIGNLEPDGTLAFPGRISLVGIFNTKLTPIQARLWFANPGVAFGCKFISRQGTARPEPDFTGNAGTGTVTGATITSEPPLPRTRL